MPGFNFQVVGGGGELPPSQKELGESEKEEIGRRERERKGGRDWERAREREGGGRWEVYMYI